MGVEAKGTTLLSEPPKGNSSGKLRSLFPEVWALNILQSQKSPHYSTRDHPTFTHACSKPLANMEPKPLPSIQSPNLWGTDCRLTSPLLTLGGCLIDLPCPLQSGWGQVISPERQPSMTFLEDSPKPHSGDSAPLPAPGGLWGWQRKNPAVTSHGVSPSPTSTSIF